MDNEQWNKYVLKKLCESRLIYKYSFVAAMLSMMLYFYVTSNYELWLPDDCLFYICFFVPLTVCINLQIITDTFRKTDTKSNILFAMLGIGGGAIFIYALFLIATQNFSMHFNFGQLFIGFCFMLTGVVYYIKSIMRKRKETRED